MQDLIPFIFYFVGISGLVAAVIYLSKNLITTRLTNAVKSEFDVKLERLKADLKLEIDSTILMLNQEASYIYKLLQNNRDNEIKVLTNMWAIVSSLTNSCALYYETKDECTIESDIKSLESFIKEYEPFIKLDIVNHLHEIIEAARPYHYNTWDNFNVKRFVLIEDIREITLLDKGGA